MNRTVFKNHLAYNWWVYVLIAVCVCLLLVYAFDIMSSAKPNERVVVFVGNMVDYESLEKQLFDELQVSSNQNIKEAYFDCLYPDTNELYFDNILATKCMGEADIIILAESQLKADTCDKYFASLGEDKLKQYFGDVTLYYENGIAYGVAVASVGCENNFCSGFTPKENYYMFFTAYSVNLAGLNGKGEAQDDAGLIAAEWLLGTDNG